MTQRTGKLLEMSGRFTPSSLFILTLHFGEGIEDSQRRDRAVAYDDYAKSIQESVNTWLSDAEIMREHDADLIVTVEGYDKTRTWRDRAGTQHAEQELQIMRIEVTTAGGEMVHASARPARNAA